jgi:acyl-CoA synthetase
MMLTLHDPKKTREQYSSGAWQQDTMFMLLRENARKKGNVVALRDATTSLTWNEVLQAVEGVAQSLHIAGLREGDRVAIWLPSRVESVIIFLACSRNGYVCCPSLHQSYTAAEIITLLKRIRCKAFFTMPAYGADAAKTSIFNLVQDVPTLINTYALGDNFNHNQACQIPDTHQFPKPLASSVDMPPPDLNPDKIVYLAFTSGTTGLPKGVMHSDNTLLANGRVLVKDWHHNEFSVLLTLSPLSHHIGTVGVEQWLVAGMQLVIHNPAAGIAALDLIIDTHATYVMGVPTHAMDILDEFRRRGLTAMGKVKSFYMAGSPIPQEVAEQFLRIGITPQNVYGMTENGSHQYTLPTDPTQTIVSTCGRSGMGYEVRIFDAENSDKELAVGEVGEIGGRGGLLMLGYFDDQTATENSFNRSGWFMTGDLGVLDQQNCLQIVGRKKDLIIRGGHNIHPAHIEDLAHRHTDIAKAAAFPIADDRLGERVCLAIIQRPGSNAGETLTASEVLMHLHVIGLSKYDMPEYFIVMDQFPLTASGKILKRDLVLMAQRGEITPEAVRFKATQTQ